MMLKQASMNSSSVRERSISKPTLVSNNTSTLNVILRANFEFVSENTYELSVSKGDLLKLISKRPGGWILVKSLDKLSNCGLIPATYVDIAINDTQHPITLEWLTSDEKEPPKSAPKSAPTTPQLSQDSGLFVPPVKDTNDRVKQIGKSLDSISVNSPKQATSRQATARTLASPEYKRSHSDAPPFRPVARTRTGSEPVNKLKSPVYSSAGDSRASFMNPYMTLKPQMKEFKSDAFNKFKAVEINPARDGSMVTPVTPISPTEPLDKPLRAAVPATRTNSTVSNPKTPKTPLSPKSSFHHSSLTSPLTIKPMTRKSSIKTLTKQASKTSLTKHISKSPPSGDKIPRESIGSPILASPMTSFNNSMSDDVDVIDFQDANYDPTAQLVSLSISNCLIHNDRYWYRIDLRYPTQKVLIAKFYNDFYNLHLEILDHKNLPKLPQPIELNQKDNDSISNILKRCNELNNYLNKLVKLDIGRVNEWLNFKNNPNYLILDNLNGNYNENELNNRILNNSISLLYRNLKVNLVNGSATLEMNLNKNELSNLNVLKSLVAKQISFNHLLMNINGKYDLIDTVDFEHIKSVDEIDLRIIN